MSYKSHTKSKGRAFDHLYDTVHKSTVNGTRKMNYKALSKTAPTRVVPCYASMFSDLITRRRNFYFGQRNSLPISSSDRKCSPKFECDRAINTNSFVLRAIEIQRGHQPEVAYQQPQKTTQSVECQTMYRESSAQTNPWMPQATLRDSGDCIPEMALLTLTSKPEIKDIESIERARIRREWEIQLPRIIKMKFHERFGQLEAFEWQSLIAREQELNENQMNRMCQVEEMIEQRQVKNESFMSLKLQGVQERNVQEVKQKKLHVTRSFTRGLRRLTKVKSSTSDISSTSSAIKSSKSSYAIFSSPNSITLGTENPKRLRHQLWKPKGDCKEISTGFRNDKNLRNLYESIKKFNDDQNKRSVQCRTRREVIKDERENSDEHDEMPQKQMKLEESVELTAIEEMLFDDLVTHECESNDLILDVGQDEKVPVEMTQQDMCDKQVVEQFVDDILQQVQEEVREILNKEILRQAAEERSKRRMRLQEKLQNEENQRLRCLETQRQIDEASQRIAECVVANAVPSLVETIAERDAKDYIQRIAGEINEVALNSSECDEEIISEILKEFLVPEVTKQTEAKLELDSEVVALVAAHDAFNCHLDELMFEDVASACED